MGFTDRSLAFYFNYVYNPVYDFTTARTSPYLRLQANCIDRLQLERGRRILCVGVGTGNEIPAIFSKNAHIELTGIDLSRHGLKQARKKAERLGKRADLRIMDAANLLFPDCSFDRVLCMHLIDFVPDGEKVIREVIRVLKPEGRFVATFPSGIGGVGLFGDIGKNVGRNLSEGHFGEAAKEVAAICGGTVLYGPTALWLRGRRRFYSREALKKILAGLAPKEYSLDEDRLYQDFIAFGTR